MKASHLNVDILERHSLVCTLLHFRWLSESTACFEWGETVTSWFCRDVSSGKYSLQSIFITPLLHFPYHMGECRRRGLTVSWLHLLQIVSSQNVIASENNYILSLVHGTHNNNLPFPADGHFWLGLWLNRALWENHGPKLAIIHEFEYSEWHAHFKNSQS